MIFTVQFRKGWACNYAPTYCLDIVNSHYQDRQKVLPRRAHILVLTLYAKMVLAHVPAVFGFSIAFTAKQNMPHYSLSS